MSFGKRAAAVSVFVIIAILIVAGVVVYFVVRNNTGEGNISPELAEVFDYYQGCIEAETDVAVKLAGMGGGRVDAGEYVPGSEYAPFSSQMNFLGSPVSYWFYVAGNGLVRENVPTKEDMKKEIEDYISQGLKECDFDVFRERGFNVSLGEAQVRTIIENTKVYVEVNAEMNVEKGEDKARKITHSAEVDSKLGKFYDLAASLYKKERANAFFENYAVDILYNYAPVDGTEIQCEPKIWLTRNVISELKEGLEVNFRTIKFGNKAKADEKIKYFVVDANVDEKVQVMYSKNWPTKIEVFGEGVDEELIVAEAIGTQEGMGIMGFCYIPYHFVYDLSFPAMIQIFDGTEVFQFPVVVVVDNNVPRRAGLSSAVGGGEEEEFDLCQYKTENVKINIYDVNLDSVDANVSYECFNQRCRIGESKNGQIKGSVPACVNGYLHLRASGFEEKKQLFSSNEESYANIVLDREYEVNISLFVGGTEVKNQTAIVSFAKKDGKSVSAALPEMKSVKLSEGNYEVKVYVYGSSSLSISATTKRQCTEVPKGGILGFLGSTEERCFDIEIPETKIENALIGGGSLNTYILDSELENGKLVIKSDRLPTPNSVEALGENFALFENKRISLEFRNE